MLGLEKSIEIFIEKFFSSWNLMGKKYVKFIT